MWIHEGRPLAPTPNLAPSSRGAPVGFEVRWALIADAGMSAGAVEVAFDVAQDFATHGVPVDFERRHSAVA